MTRDQLIARMRVVLGFRHADKEAEIVAELKAAQQDLEKLPDLPWFLKTEVASKSTEADEERVNLPSNFLREQEDGALFYFNSTATDDADKWVELVKDFTTEHRKNLPGEGAPLGYTLDELYFRIFPTPDAVYLLKMRFFKSDTVLDSNVENEWTKHAPNLLGGIAGQTIAGGLRDSGAMQIFASWEARGLRQLLVDNQAREDANFEYVMGGVD